MSLIGFPSPTPVRRLILGRDLFLAPQTVTSTTLSVWLILRNLDVLGLMVDLFPG